MSRKRLACWESISGDGSAFENIVKKLLKAMFPFEDYVHTQKTRDGGKDFICITKKSSKYWAECKNYSSSLATSDVAKTFVMAIAEHVNMVMIFSISPLTDIAIQEICRFTQRSPYKIKLYDGDALNSLVNKYINEIDLGDTFKEQFLLSYSDNNACTVFSNVYRNNYYSDNVINKTFSVGDLLIYNFYFKNNTQNNINIEYSIQQENFPDELILIESNTELFKSKFEIEANGYVQISYKFRIINYKNQINLFGINYSINNITKFLKGKKIKCNWIAEVALLGKSRMYFQKLQEQYIGANTLSLINIYGHSGVGKSRLLKEIKNTCEDNNEKTLFISVQNTEDAGKILIQKLISYIKNLPYLPGTNISVNSQNFVYQFLYNSQFNFDENLDKIAALILETLNSNEKIYVIIDDLQFGNQLMINFVRKILFSTLSSIILVTGFNVDYLFSQTEIFNLFEQIKACGSETFNKNIVLDGFDNNIAEEYLRNCLKLDNLHEKLLHLFIKNCGTNPLVLHQTLMLLEQDKILVKNNDCFYINDLCRFHRVLQELTSDLNSLLRKRHMIIKKNLTKDEYTYYCTFLSILSVFRKISYEFYNKIFISDKENKELYFLISHGLVKINDEGDIIFYHQKLESFYFSLQLGDFLDQTVLNQIYTISDNFFSEIFIIKNKFNQVTEADFRKAIYNLKNINYNNEYRYVRAIFNEKNTFKLNNNENLKIIECYYRIVQKHKGLRYKIDEYKQEIEMLYNNIEKYVEQGTLVWRIFLTYINACIQLHDNSNALKNLIKFQSKLEILCCDNKEKKNIEAALYDRLGVIYSTFSNLKKATYCFKHSLKLGLQIKDKYKIIEAYSDLGSLYYDQKGKIKKTYRYWNALYKYYTKNISEEYEYLIPKCYYHKIYVYLLQHKYKKAEKKLNEYKRLFWGQTEGHYKIKMLFANIAIELLKNDDFSKANCLEISFLLNKAEDECLYYGTVREYYKIFYLRGIFLLLFEKNEKEAYENFQITYKKIFDFCDNNNYMIQKYIPILDELNKIITELSYKYGNTDSCLLHYSYFNEKSRIINHIKNNEQISYIMPLQDKKHIFKLPKL